MYSPPGNNTSASQLDVGLIYNILDLFIIKITLNGIPASIRSSDLSSVKSIATLKSIV